MILLIGLICMYLLLEVMAMSIFGRPMPITVYLICSLLVLILGKKSCIVGLHDWEYYRQKHKAMGVKDMRQVTVHKLKCMKCDKKKYSFHDPCTNMFDKWTEGELPEILKFKTLD